jgi:D-serine deaminase-like pyridoxal phosphate-dependent protein
MIVEELPTPFLTVDLDAVGRNVDRVQCYCDAI